MPTFLSFREELFDSVKRSGGLHFLFHSLLYPFVLFSHRRQLPLFVFKALLDVVAIPPVLHQSLDFRYREHVVLEIVYDFQQLVLRPRRLPRLRTARIESCSAIGAGRLAVLFSSKHRLWIWTTLRGRRCSGWLLVHYVRCWCSWPLNRIKFGNIEFLKAFGENCFWSSSKVQILILQFKDSGIRRSKNLKIHIFFFFESAWKNCASENSNVNVMIQELAASEIQRYKILKFQDSKIQFYLYIYTHTHTQLPPTSWMHFHVTLKRELKAVRNSRWCRWTDNDGSRCWYDRIICLNGIGGGWAGCYWKLSW